MLAGQSEQAGQGGQPNPGQGAAQAMPQNTGQPQMSQGGQESGRAFGQNQAQSPQGQANMSGQTAMPGQVMQAGTPTAGMQGQTMSGQNPAMLAGQSEQAGQGGQPNAGQGAAQAMPQNMGQPQMSQGGQESGRALGQNQAQSPQGQVNMSGQTAMPGQVMQAGTPTAGMQGQVMPGQNPAMLAGQAEQANAGQNQAQVFGQSVQNSQNATQSHSSTPVNHGEVIQGNVNSNSNISQAEQIKRPQQAAMQQAKERLLNQVMENTPQTMNALRDLAQLLLRDGNVNQKDALLLQSFINGKEALMNAKEAQQLQQLIRLCQANVPATIQQAALQQNIPDLPRLWAFMQLCDMTYTRNMTARQLKKAGKDVAAFVLSMRNSMEGDNSIVPGQRSLNFMLPMYMGEESTYPAYIHVYDEKQPDPETGELKKETWLRLCVLTDNIGAVELTCRVYQENQLDMRLFFSNPEAANEFRSEADTLRNSLKDSKLKLKEFKIGAAGERRFM